MLSSQNYNNFKFNVHTVLKINAKFECLWVFTVVLNWRSWMMVILLKESLGVADICIPQTEILATHWLLVACAVLLIGCLCWEQYLIGCRLDEVWRDFVYDLVAMMPLTLPPTHVELRNIYRRLLTVFRQSAAKFVPHISVLSLGEHKNISNYWKLGSEVTIGTR